MMRSTGIVRKTDQLGRIVLPKELRRGLNIGIKDPLEILIDTDKIVLQKYDVRSACAVTGLISDDNVVLMDGKLVLSKEVVDNILPALEKYAKKES